VAKEKKPKKGSGDSRTPRQMSALEKAMTSPHETPQNTDKPDETKPDTNKPSKSS